MVWIKTLDCKNFERIMSNCFYIPRDIVDDGIYNYNIIKEIYKKIKKDDILIMDSEPFGFKSLYGEGYEIYENYKFTNIKDFIFNLNYIKKTKPFSILILSTIYTDKNNLEICVRCKFIDDYRKCDSKIINKFISDIRKSKINILLNK